MWPLLLLLAVADCGGPAPTRANGTTTLCSSLAHTINDAACASVLRSLPSTACLGMIDACGKLPSGILQGNVYSLGSFDECKVYQSDGATYARFAVNTTALLEAVSPLGECTQSTCTGQRA